MRLPALIACTAVAALAATPALGRPRPAETAKRTARAALTVCDPAQRQLQVEARMAGSATGQRLAVRFDLYRRVANAGFKRLATDATGTWMTANPGTDIYNVQTTVAQLQPATYRVAVRFRWSSPDGRVLARQLRVTRTCRVPDTRPNLRALKAAIAAGPGAGRARYVLTFANASTIAAPPFDVGVTVAGQALPPVAVPAQAPRDRRSVTIPGPRCEAGSLVTFTLDVGNAVDERDETDNALTLRCRL